MINIRRIGINMISGGAGYIVPMVIQLVATPYVIKMLGNEAYGLQVLANVVIGYLMVADMGMDIPVTKKIAEYYASNDAKRKSDFLIATIKIYFLIGLVGMLLVFVFSGELIVLLSIPSSLVSEARTVFYLTAFGFMGSIINMWGRAVFNGLHRYDIANAVGIFNNIFGILLGIFLLANGQGVVGFFFARIAGLFLSNLIYLFLAKKHVEHFKVFPFVDKEIWSSLKKQIGYGFSLRISGMIFLRMDQTLISAWIGIAAVTIYSIPILIATTLNALIGSLIHFTFPMASSMTSTHSVKELNSFFFKVSKFINCISAVSFIPFLVFGDKFLALWISAAMSTQAHTVFFLLLISSYINTCLITTLAAFMAGIGQLKAFTFYAVGRSLFLFLGFLVFIRLYGIEGAGLSFLFSTFVDLTFFYHAVRKKLNIDIFSLLADAYLKPVGLAVVLACMLIPLRGFVNTWMELIMVFGAFAIVFLIVAWKVEILGDSEKKLLLALLNKK